MFTLYKPGSNNRKLYLTAQSYGGLDCHAEATAAAKVISNVIKWLLMIHTACHQQPFFMRRDTHSSRPCSAYHQLRQWWGRVGRDGAGWGKLGRGWGGVEWGGGESGCSNGTCRILSLHYEVFPPFLFSDARYQMRLCVSQGLLGGKYECDLPPSPVPESLNQNAYPEKSIFSIFSHLIYVSLH